MTTPEEYRHKLNVLQEHCRNEKREPETIRQGMIVRAILDQDMEAPDDKTFVCSSEEFVKKLIPYREMGVQDFLLLSRPPADKTTLEAFITRVAPKLR